jgi:hypothetical protein
LRGLGRPGNANQLVTRVVQKASFRSPKFIGFYAPISEIRAGPLPTGFWPEAAGLLGAISLVVGETR